MGKGPRWFSAVSVHGQQGANKLQGTAGLVTGTTMQPRRASEGAGATAARRVLTRTGVVVFFVEQRPCVHLLRKSAWLVGSRLPRNEKGPRLSGLDFLTSTPCMTVAFELAVVLASVWNLCEPVAEPAAGTREGGVLEV